VQHTPSNVRAEIIPFKSQPQRRRSDCWATHRRSSRSMRIFELDKTQEPQPDGCIQK